MTEHLDKLFTLLADLPHDKLSQCVTAVCRYQSIVEGPRPAFAFKEAAETALARVARLIRVTKPALAADLFVAPLDSADDVRAALALTEGLLDASAARLELVALLAWHMATEHAARRHAVDPNHYAVPTTR